MWVTWVVAIVFGVLWLAIAATTLSYKVHQQRIRLDHHVETHIEEPELNRVPTKPPVGVDAGSPKTWTIIIAGLVVFGLALAAFALLVDAVVRGWSS